MKMRLYSPRRTKCSLHFVQLPPQFMGGKIICRLQLRPCTRRDMQSFGVAFFFSTPKTFMKESGPACLPADGKETCERGGSSRGRAAQLCSSMLMSFGNAVPENLSACFEVSIKRFISAEKVFI